MLGIRSFALVFSFASAMQFGLMLMVEQSSTTSAALPLNA